MFKTQYLFFIGLIILNSISNNKCIVRFNEPGFNLADYKIIPVYTDFNDTIQGDTLYEYIDSNQLPAMYSRKVVTGVCIDGECRIVKMELFWVLTGRYMGFRLEENEFLSKSKHSPFADYEYDRLHKLLSDPNSGLAQYRIDELIPTKKKSLNQVDAVSSATIAAVLEFIVEGAVYTTYTLWHIVYGNTRKEIQKRTSANLNPEVILKLLNSDKNEEVVWVLNHFPVNTELSGKILEKLLGFIEGSDVYLAERSLNAMNPGKITPAIQQRIARVFNASGFIHQRMLLGKFADLPAIDNLAVLELSNDITRLNGAIVKILLELFQIKKINNKTVTEKVALLIENENRFIVGQALKYLESLPFRDKKMQKKIDQVKKDLKL